MSDDRKHDDGTHGELLSAVHSTDNGPYLLFISVVLFSATVLILIALVRIARALELIAEALQ